MGVPTLFISIFRNKNYKNVHAGLKVGETNANYFFLDYNGIVYSAYERIKKNIEGKNLTKNKIEELLIEEVIRYTKYLICNVVKPSQLTYISLDGPAPRAKMVQQRSRRYKGYYDKILFENEKKKHNLYEVKDTITWDKSANISPGTEFMEKLSKSLKLAMESNVFLEHNPEMKMILSDGAVPGEGEHKFLDLIRKMRVQKKYKDDVIYIYGKDADLIVLAVSTQKSNIHIMREVKSETDYELKKMYESYEFLDLNIDNLRIGFNDEITKSFPGNHGFNKMRILNDYIFLTFLVGNDFVMSMPFLKVRKDGLKTLIAIYHDIKLNHSDYLVLYNQDIKNDVPKINVTFLQELFLEISKKEDFLMKKQQEEVNRLMRGGVQDRRMTAEAIMTPYEIYESRYIHLEVCHPQHPMYSKYFEDFMKIDYKKDYEAWKELYYNNYLGVNKTDMESYDRVRMNCVKNYLESLMFSLKYYFCGVPSWTWHYKFRVSPLPSDVFHALKSDIFNPNNFVFQLGEPYTPFQQLMLILPPQMNALVPSVLRPIMNDDKLLCTQFYPVDFRIDASVGIKTQYSEAILPEIDDELLINTVKEHEKDLTACEKERNKIREKPLGT